jgi:hypothetical protein
LRETAITARLTVSSRFATSMSAARSSVSFAPPQPGLDGRLHQQLRVGVRQGRVERVELRGR